MSSPEFCECPVSGPEFCVCPVSDQQFSECPVSGPEFNECPVSVGCLVIEYCPVSASYLLPGVWL